MKSAFTKLMIVLVGGLGAACAGAPAPQAAPISEDSLFGRWSLTHVGHCPVSRGMTMEFRRDGVMAGTYRCNSMSGPYEVRPPAVVFPTSVIITAAGCSSDWPANQQTVEVAERVLFADPPPTWSLSLDGRLLYVHGREKLQFVRGQ